MIIYVFTETGKLKKKAKSKGIRMFNIMPGSSHWFQVHDQKPFGMLKKRIKEKKFEFLSLISVPPEVRKDLLTCILYQAEVDALEENIIRKTFNEVGLWPWNPEQILKISKEHCSSLGELKKGPLVRKLLRIINNVKQDKEGTMRRILRSMKHVSVEVVQKGDEVMCSDEENEDSDEDGEQEGRARRRRKSKGITNQPPTKRRRILRSSKKTCCAKGCKKTHFWSKKWKICSKCKKELLSCSYTFDSPP